MPELRGLEARVGSGVMNYEGYDKLLDEQAERVEQALRAAGLEPPFHVRYSAYDKRPGDNLAKVAVVGRVRFWAPNDGFWGEGDDYLGPVLEDPTWLDLCSEAERMIRTTGDGHHAFLEGVHPTGTSDLELLASASEDESCQTYTFIMGS